MRAGVSLGLAAWGALTACGGGTAHRRDAASDGPFYEATVVTQPDLKPAHFEALKQVLPERLGDTPLLREDAGGRRTPVKVQQLPPAAQQALYIVMETGDPAAVEWDLRVRLADDRRTPVSVRRAPGEGFVLRWGETGEALVRGRGQDLERRYGIGALREEQGAVWTPRAREVLDEALAVLDPGERRVLAGVPFVRRPRGEDPEHGALYVQTDCQAEVFLYDVALRSDAEQFVGEPEAPIPTSVRTLLHEIGHALHQRPGRVAWCAVERAEAALKARIEAVNARAEAYNRQARAQPVADAEGARRTLNALQAEQAAVERDRDAFEAQTKAARAVVDGGPVLEAYAAALGDASPPTRYGRTSLKESFAESYSLYRADPAALKRLLPAVFAFFERGGHVVALGAPDDT